MMDKKVKQALNFVKGAWDISPFPEDKYHEALTVLVDNCDQLMGRVFFVLPGDLTGNSNANKWNHIKANSESRCFCGNERVIQPHNIRETFEAKRDGQVVVSRDKGIYLKPVGGDEVSTYAKLWIMKADDGEPALAYMMDPHAPLVLSMDWLSTPGWKLSDLADVLEKSTSATILSKYLDRTSDKRVPLCSLDAINGGVVTITLDKDVELQGENVKKCKCMW